ncbi:MAG TPA: hypothetical protein VFK86_16315 [Bauldia sp.]|nr:hypothetical protein [Bauldia sp.]
MGLLIPVKPTDRDRLAKVLAEAEALAKERDPKDDEALLAEIGEVDPTDWTMKAARAFFVSPANSPGLAATPRARVLVAAPAQ